MNDFSCDREQEIVSALRSGTLGPDLLRHTDTCPVCADVVAVTQFSQEEARIALELPLPDASFIWRKAQLRSRHEAMARATRPIRVLTNLAYVAAVVAGLWLVINVAGLPTWLSELNNYRVPIMHLASGYLSATVLMGGIGTLLCAYLGSSYLLLSDRSRTSRPGRLRS
jgi:hypothetical protein